MLCPDCGRSLEDGQSCARCASKSTSSTFPEIPGYRILSLLGEGGMGAVYLAEEPELGRKVAIKIISERFSPESEATARFLREARTMATVEHPHVVRIYALGHVGRVAYLAMEYVEGETLAERISHSGRLSKQEALETLRQIVDALEASWEKKVVHRDIKPSNILIDKKNQIHVADFGLAKPVQFQKDRTLTGEGSILGTPHYISPEQALGRVTDFRSDVYSLGIVFYEMLTGEKPFEGTTPFEIVNQHISSPLPSLRDIRPDVSGELIRLLEWMTQKDPAKRPSSYAVIRDAINAYLAEPETRTISALHWIPKPSFRKMTVAIGVVLILIAGALLIRNIKIGKAQVATISEEALPTVAIAPFYGPDEDSSKEGRLMASLVEQSIRNKLGNEVQVIGIEQTKDAVQSQNSAQNLGERFRASVVIWGETYSVRNETEVQPHFTLVREKKSPAGMQFGFAGVEEDPFVGLIHSAEQRVILKSEVPNQIELRKTSAAGIGQMVSLFAGIHALYQEEDAQKALSLFDQTEPSAESYCYRARALLQMGHRDQAMGMLQQSLQMDPQYAPANALFGDLKMTDGAHAEAVVFYQRAFDTKQEFTTSRAILYDGKLYSKQFYQSEKYTDGKEQETSWLIGIEPGSDKVVERYHLPGIPSSFTLQNDSLQIMLDIGSGEESRFIFRHGRFDHPLFEEPDLLLRIQSMQSGWATAANFMGDWENAESIGQAKFEPGKILYQDAPTTLPELEENLRSAIKKDPTQPWNDFFLGQALWWQSKKEDAGKVWSKITAERYPYMPYYELSWMASLFEAFGQNGWADHAYRQALKRRKQLLVPIESSSFVERLINANFLRTAAYASRQEMKPQRAYTWLTRARELTGVCPDGDDFAAAAWGKYFDSKNDPAQAKHEEKYFDMAQTNPLNTVRATTLYDYSFYFLIAVTLSFLTVSALIFLRAVAAQRHSNVNGIKEGPPRSKAIRMGSYALLVVITLFAGFKLMRMLNIELFIAIFSLAFILLFLVRSEKISTKRVFAAVSPQHRKVFALAFFVMLISLAIPIYFNRCVQVLLSRPLDASDSIENPALLQFMEQRLKEVDTKEIRYSVAVLNQMSGRRERARQLYESLLDDQRAHANLEAIDQVIPPNRISPEDLYRSFVALPWKSWFDRIWNPGQGLNVFYSDSSEISPQEDLASFFFQIAILTCFAVLLLFILIPAWRGKEVPVPRKRSRFFLLALPGSFDIQNHKSLRGYISLTLFLFCLSVLLVQLLIPHHRFPVQGVVTFLLMPNYQNSLPFPSPTLPADADTVISYHYWPIFWAYPYARVFWGFLFAGALSSIILHIRSLRTDWRTRYLMEPL
jgi:serine/threonine protein kinase/tetratricopeptide (TPR) repeat protein